MNIDRKIINEFIYEVKEHLDEVEAVLLAIEKGTLKWNKDTVDGLFRNIHTIKGNAGFFSLTKINTLAHAMETVLTGLRTARITPTPELSDVLLQAVDTFRKLVNRIDEPEQQDISLTLKLLEEFIPRETEEQEIIKLIDIDTNDCGIELPRFLLQNIPPEHEYLYQLKYNIKDLLTDHDLTPVALVKRLLKLGQIQQACTRTPFKDLHEGLPTEKFLYNVIFSTVIEPALIADAVCLDKSRINQLKFSRDKIKPDSQEELVTREMIDKFVIESQELLEKVESLVLAIEKDPGAQEHLDEAFRLIHSLKGNASFFEYHQTEKACTSFEEKLEAIRHEKQPPDARIINALLRLIDLMRQQMTDREIVPAASSDPGDKHKLVGEILLDMGQLTEADLEQALLKQNRKLGEILVEDKIIARETLDQALAIQEKRQPASDRLQAPNNAYILNRKDIRVDMAKLDRLFDLMGELVTAEAMIFAHPEIQRLQLQDFNQTATFLSKITREMQEITMSIRMVPLQGLFHKMNRLVRDLARKFDKQAKLVISGEETEMDRNVIEEISDPLIHLIRNALDHGLEAGPVRAEAGKDACGTIKLNAKHEGNEIWIEVEDDGAGLNTAEILALARQRGLVKEENLKDQQIWKLIFEPGFSTAETVSEISGRGVGMDVVRRNLEKLRGKVDIFSTPGQGTRFVLKIPLTLAIIEGVTARVGRVHYAIPIIDIVEFHKAGPGQLVRLDTDREVLKLREEIFPIIKIWQFFSISTAKQAVNEGIMIICKDSGGRRAALLVDEIISYQQIVIKPLPEYMGDRVGISGCSILGNGSINLIMDIGAIIGRSLDKKHYSDTGCQSS